MGKFLAGIVGAVLISILSGFLVTFAAAPDKGATASLIGLVAGFVVAVAAPNAGKAWRRIFLASAILSFMAPLSGIIFTGRTVAEIGSHSAAEAAGAAIGGGLVSGAMGFVGFFLGVIFLIIGLLTGRDKQIVYVKMVGDETAPKKGPAHE